MAPLLGLKTGSADTLPLVVVDWAANFVGQAGRQRALILREVKQHFLKEKKMFGDVKARLKVARENIITKHHSDSACLLYIQIQTE